MHACGDDDQPYYTSTPVHDVTTGVLVTLGTLAALVARARIGRGQRVSMSLAASSLLVQCEELTEYPGRPAPRRGGTPFVGDAPTRRYYRAADGWLAVVAEPDRLPALVSWSGASAGDAPTEAIIAAMSTRRAADVIAELRGLGTAAVQVVEREELATDAHLVAHHLRHVVHDAEIGRCLVVNQVAEWSRSVPVETTSVPQRETDLAVMSPPTAPR